MARLAIIVLATLFLCSCDDDYKLDTTPIAHDDFARIQLESDLCKSGIGEHQCLKHLKGRIQ